jgi:hypothetical protein
VIFPPGRGNARNESATDWISHYYKYQGGRPRLSLECGGYRRRICDDQVELKINQFFREHPRPVKGSATIQAEVASVLYEIGADAFVQIKRQHPALSLTLLSYVIAVMAERLSFASRLIGVLQR